MRALLVGKGFFPVLLIFLSLSSSCADEDIEMCSAAISGNKIIFYVYSFSDKVCALLAQDKVGGKMKKCGSGVIEINIDDIRKPDKFNYEIQREGEMKICEGTLSLPVDTLSFAVIGDTSYKSGFLPQLISKILDFSPNIVFHVGDFQYETRKDRWSRLLRYFEPIFSNSFFFLSPGNHEYESQEDVVKLRRYFPYEGFSSFEWKGVLFVSTNIHVEQQKWKPKLSESIDIAKRKNLPVILFLHIPLVSLSRWSDTKLNKELFEIIYPYVKVVFVGHDHVYGRVQINELSQIVSGGGGATIYGCVHKSDRIAEEYKNIGSVEIRIEKCIEDFNVVLCELKDDLNCEAISPTRGSIDNFSIKIITR